MNGLFPVSAASILSGFTTSPAAASIIPQLSLVSLSDAALGVHKVTSQTTHSVVAPPLSDPNERITQAWEAFFPAGSINPGNKEAPRGGFGFYLRGPKPFAEKLQKDCPQEIIMSYAIMFEEGWQWQKGGKLPGICMCLLHARLRTFAET